MAKRADESKASTQVANSRRKRVTIGTEPVSASQRLKKAEAASEKGRAVHARTQSKADAKAAKEGDGKRAQRWRTGPNGGEEQTTNSVAGPGRGADGPPGRPSRKSTRGSWAAGEKRAAPLQRREIRATHSPEARATMKK
jgi:hypothetical protein